MRRRDRVDGTAPCCRLYSSVFEPRCGQEICYFTQPSKMALGWGGFTQPPEKLTGLFSGVKRGADTLPSSVH